MDKAYLAGLIDADGCIAITMSGRHHSLRVHITSVDKEFLDYWCRKVGLGKVYPMN